MTISIQPVSTSEKLSCCHQMQVAIFHHELQLFGMEIPDDYDQSSVYMQILDADVVVGTYRLVFPSTSVGLPIEESGFDLKQFHQKKVCEMSRLVLLKEKRGKMPFSKIFSSACRVARQHNASILLVAILPKNLPLFKRYGFSQVGLPLYDSSVKSTYNEESVIIPMQMHI